MSVCVSSALNGGMTHVSHLHMTSTLSMMHSFQNHQMAPSSIVDMPPSAHSQSQPNQLMQNASSTDPNEPNSEMLLALIARNKTLEGKYINFIFILFTLRFFFLVWFGFYLHFSFNFDFNAVGVDEKY